MAKISWESEKELEDWIFNKAKETLENPLNGEEIHSIYRQVDLGAYGILDLITFWYAGEYIEVTIIEVKKEHVTTKAIAQLSRYKKAIHDYFNSHKHNINLRIFAVAPEMSIGDDTVFLSDLVTDFFDFKSFTCSVDLEKGVSFKQSYGWHKQNETFQKFSELWADEFKRNGNLLTQDEPEEEVDQVEDLVAG